MKFNIDADLKNGHTEKELRLLETLEDFRSELIKTLENDNEEKFVHEYKESTYEELLELYMLNLMISDADKRYGNK